MGRARLAILAVLIAAMTGPAMAQKKGPSYVTPPPALRGAQTAAPTPVAPTPSRQPDQSLDPLLQPPVDNTARLGGLEQERAGGAICRQACAQTYYFCLTNEDAQTCAASWTTCLTACPTNSSRQ
jgi:hypothetical protein